MAAPVVFHTGETRYSLTTGQQNEVLIGIQTCVGEVGAKLEKAAMLFAEAAKLKEAARENSEKAKLYSAEAQIYSDKAKLSNEAAQMSTEKAKLSNEAAQMSIEKAKLSNEAAQLSAEKAKVSSDAAQVSKEKARESDEKAKKAGEDAKIHQDKARELEKSSESKKEAGDQKLALVQKGRQDFLTTQFFAIFYPGKKPVATEMVSLYDKYLADGAFIIEKNPQETSYLKIKSMLPVISYLANNLHVKTCNFRVFKAEVHDVTLLANYLKTSKIAEVTFSALISPDSKAILMKAKESRTSDPLEIKFV